MTPTQELLARKVQERIATYMGISPSAIFRFIGYPSYVRAYERAAEATATSAGQPLSHVTYAFALLEDEASLDIAFASQARRVHHHRPLTDAPPPPFHHSV